MKKKYAKTMEELKALAKAQNADVATMRLCAEYVDGPVYDKCGNCHRGFVRQDNAWDWLTGRCAYVSCKQCDGTGRVATYDNGARAGLASELAAVAHWLSKGADDET